MKVKEEKAEKIINILRKLSNKKKAKIFSSFFKTGKGEYGEGDVFLGISVPEIRKLVTRFSNLELKDIKIILYSKYHEARLLALLILVYKYEGAGIKEKKIISDFYFRNKEKVNNWDLVDSSAHKILGNFYFNKKTNPFSKLVKSKSIWDRRIAIISSFYNIRKNDFGLTVDMCSKLIADKHDLIHKACGWMLREIGNRSEIDLIMFLNKNYKNMPRTMLRYSIERLDKEKKNAFMNNLI